MHKRNVILMVLITIVILFTVTPWETSTPASAGFFNSWKNPHHIIVSQGETAETITVSWKGNADGPSYAVIIDEGGVEKSSGARKKKILKGSYYRYWVEFNDLKAEHQYTIKIGESVRFAWEIPREDKETTFIYMGDIQGNYESWSEMCASMPETDLVLTGGDMVNSGKNSKQWNDFLGNSGMFMSVPVMTAAGNHEGKTSNETYKSVFALPDNGPEIETLKESFYYFDHGICRVIVMDSSFLTDERRKNLGDKWEHCEAAVEKWLEETLADSEAVWNIVVTHHPPYGFHDFDTTSPQIRELWTPIMEEGGVDLVLCGHQHMYMRTNKIRGITYVMGNAGQRESEFYMGYNEPLYAEVVDSAAPNYQQINVTENKLEIVSKTKTGLVIDKTVIRKSLRFHIFEFFSGN